MIREGQGGNAVNALKGYRRLMQQELLEILVRTASQPYLDVARQATEIRLKLTVKHQSFTDSVELLREGWNR